MSPYASSGQGVVMELGSNSYNNTDFMLGSLYHYITTDGKRKDVNYNKEDDVELMKYSAAQLYQHDSADSSPSIKNVDYQSVHTFRSYHGIVDWFMGLPFTFFTEGGIENSYPLYATPA